MAAAREIQVEIANEPGTLAAISDVLGRAGINIQGFGVWVATAHLLVSDVERAEEILRREGFLYRVADVLRLELPDEPGNLAEISQAIGDAGINIDYAYTVTGTAPGSAAFVLAMANTDEAEELLD
jgi:hypothetical protein